MKFCDRCGWDGSFSAREEARMRHLRTIRFLKEVDRRRSQQYAPVSELLLYQPCDREHRPPQGPNEDVDVCECGRLSWCLRPEGETYGHHAPDCSLPERHEGYCQPGGQGHRPAAKIRGYWPLLVSEAIASTALDRDPDGGTRPV